MGNYNRDDRGGNRGGFSSRGRSAFGRRGRSSFGNDRGPKEMFKATCDNCGKECEVPFRPTSGKPVYCSDCFEKMGGRNAESRPRRDTSFEDLNAKLDKIISLLEPKETVKKVKKVASE